MNNAKIIEVTFRLLVDAQVDAQKMADDMQKDVVDQLVEEHGATYSMLPPKQIGPIYVLPEYEEDGASRDRCIEIAEAYEALYDWILNQPSLPRQEMWCCHGECQNIHEAYLVAGYAICTTCGWVDKNDEAFVEPVDSPV